MRVLFRKGNFRLLRSWFCGGPYVEVQLRFWSNLHFNAEGFHDLRPSPSEWDYVDLELSQHEELEMFFFCRREMRAKWDNNALILSALQSIGRCVGIGYATPNELFKCVRST